jgi:hypothetical protein
LDNKHWYDHVPKSFETVIMVRLPYYGTNKCKPTELFPTINRTSEAVIVNKEHAC